MLLHSFCIHFWIWFIMWMVMCMVVVVLMIVIMSNRCFGLFKGTLHVTACIYDFATFVETTGTARMVRLYWFLALFADRKSHWLQRKMRGTAALV